MTIKSKLLTSAAALTLVAGPAFAESQTLETDAEIKTETEMSADAGAYAPGWNEDLESSYGDIADRQVAELIGMNVVTEGGDDVGEVDNFVIMEDTLQAVVGVGGFLGLGEHHVALSLSDLTYDGDRLVIPFTAEELEAMPAYTEELEQTALNETDTFRTRGDMEAPADQDSEMAATQLESDENAENADSEAMQMADGTAESDADEAAAPTGEEVAAAEEAAGDEDTMTEEVAEAEKGEIEQEAEELAAETDAAVEEGTEEVADAGAEAEAAVEEGTEEVADAGAEAEAAVEEGAEDVAQATEDAAAETEQMAENAAAETEAAAEEGAQELADAGAEAEAAAEDGAEEVADAAAATGEAVEEGAEDVAQATENAAEGTADWLANFEEIAEWTAADIAGTPVATANGDVIGEVDLIGTQNDKLVAVVGVGGFLGLGEHDVALDMAEMSWDGEKFIADGYTEEQLKEMAEYDAETLQELEADVTLRSQANL